jgi:SOS-response transcriptional repressor LexA
MGLSTRQSQTLHVIVNYFEEHGSAPTQEELRERMGLRGTRGTRDRIAALKAVGYLVELPGRSAYRIARLPNGCWVHPTLVVTAWPKD